MSHDIKLFYLLYAENSDCGDPASSANVRHFLSREAARAEMKASFVKHKDICGLPAAEDDEHDVTITDDEIIIHDGLDTFRWKVGEATPEVPV